MISYPFFDLFSVEARVFACTLPYEGNAAIWDESGRDFRVKLCPVGGCCFYDDAIPPTFSDHDLTAYMPLGEQLAEPLGVSAEEVNDFIQNWEDGLIAQEDLPLVMGLT